MAEIKIVPSRPAMIMEGEKRHLIVTDLHIGFESSLGSNEIFIGKNTSINETISEIKDIINETAPDDLILLGDLKSSVKSISKNEWDEIPRFLQEINKKVETILIPGNHDANIQRMVPSKTVMASSNGMVLENVLLTHGHTMPSENFAHVDKIIMGHLHPVFFQEESVINGQKVWVSIKADKHLIFPSQNGKIEITIIPSFNRYLYATRRHYHKKSISPIIQRLKKISAARIITLDGSIIGDESIIKDVID